MNIFNHTPGPWRYDALDEATAWILDGNGYYLAELVSHDSEGFFEARSGVRESNGRLMAAAPDLLSACKAALGVLEEIWNDFPEEIEEGDISVPDQLKLAIKKAKGE